MLHTANPFIGSINALLHSLSPNPLPQFLITANRYHQTFAAIVQLNLPTLLYQ